MFEPELPTTVTSHARSGDKSVEVSDVSRILAVSLSGSVADYVYTLGLGGNLVGRDVSDDAAWNRRLTGRDP